MVPQLPIASPLPESGFLPSNLSYTKPSDPKFGVYVHIPFCKARCGYCDFNTYTSDELAGATHHEYADLLVREIAHAARVLQHGGSAPSRIDTIFFGGGTPTLLPSADLVKIIDALRAWLPFASDIEITVEANPDSVTFDSMAQLVAGGVNRFSFGMQSAVPAVLAVLDRSHNPQNVANCAAYAKALNVPFSLDLIYGAPGESLDDWRFSLDTALALEPDHLSAYALIIEQGTRLARQIKQGKVAAPSDDLQADMYELLDARMVEAGYSWYELSNWVRKSDGAGFSRHNYNYWLNHDWWGFGPGAHSHIAGVRFWNVKHPSVYAERLRAGVTPVLGHEVISVEQARLEQVMLRVRLAEGLDKSSVSDAHPAAIAKLISLGLIDAAAALRSNIVLTLKGRLMADAVVRELIV